jgi:membrane dipeptidase
VKVQWSSLHIPEPAYFRCFWIRLLARLLKNGRKLRKLSAWDCLLLQMGLMERQVARAQDRFRVVRSYDELGAALDAGRTAVVHTVEGGHVLGAGLEAGDLDGRLDRLAHLAERGVASLTLAHLFPNDLAGHAEAIPGPQHKILTCRLNTEVDLNRGLTDAGKAVVDSMVGLRVIPDITHCTPVARQQVYDRVGGRIPVIASHIGVQSMNEEKYNLDRSDVDAIVASGGVVGVIFMPYWLDRTHPGPGLDAIWRTMEQLYDWSGASWEHVAIGTDFDGFTDPPDDCKNSGELPRVRARLEQKGLRRAEVEAILGTNARRVLRDGWR